MTQPLADWTPPSRAFATLDGRTARLEPFAAAHAPDLHAAFTAGPSVWDYLPYGPFEGADAYADWLLRLAAPGDPFPYAVCDKASGKALGIATYLRIAPAQGTIEIGHIAFSTALQNTAPGTEALILMIEWAFEAGYRRVEWKCDALNLGSRRAAQRLGLSFEGVHRQAAIVRGRNRDTAWFSALDSEWPALSAAYRAWLDPENFDGDGRQRRALSTLTRPILSASDPALSLDLG